MLELAGSSARLLAFGRISPPPSLPFPERLKIIFEGLTGLIALHGPQAASLEDVFTFRNPRTAFRLAQARGAAMVALSLAAVPVYEYAPALVKSAVCGSGRAEKSQVAYMVSQTLGIREKPPEDATDALACALCHAGQAAVMDILPGAPLRSASRARAASWRNLTPADLAAMGYRIEGKGK